MIRITVQLADISPSQSAALGKLPVISHPAQNRRLSWPNYMVVSWFYPTNYASSSITHYKKTTFSTGTHRTLHVLPMMCYINWQKCLHLQMPQLSYRFEKKLFFFHKQNRTNLNCWQQLLVSWLHRLQIFSSLSVFPRLLHSSNTALLASITNVPATLH